MTVHFCGTWQVKMTVTETWLEVKNCHVIVLDAATARRQSARAHKKRKAAAKNQRKAKRSKHNSAQHSQNDDSEEEAVDENDQLFTDAQSQLQQEMEAAGFDVGELPMSFGSSSTTVSRNKRKRPRDESNIMHQLNSATKEVEKEVSVEKIRVTFDSDGEVAERSTETVVIAVKSALTEEAPEHKHVSEDSGNRTVIKDTSPEEAAPDVDPSVLKFWKQRRSLFRKYDEGILLDQESWYSVTPEAIAEYIAQRCACDVIVDPFSGCGGNIIQFAKTCKHVIAIEIDEDKIRMAKHNAAIYGVADKIEWIHGDAIQVLPTLQADIVFLSPPWGGMNYSRQAFSIESMMIGDSSGVDLFALARQVSKNVVYYLPKTTPDSDLQSLAPGESVECERLHLSGQLKVVNAYYGELAFPEAKGSEEATVHDDEHKPRDTTVNTEDSTVD